ncbi:hypothetical protein GTP23_11140 [Pseudoduganella sp. FT93W]|uniref:Uncharacterized protein n=1 Tax=Duganella fentianensis TaxID=2692177 RepID=A0A845HXL5_9BURK|nr:hypothetical protein [Duganella fentianensis]MYN45602.1 hypothetical protein [Duganella fentianensis]
MASLSLDLAAIHYSQLQAAIGRRSAYHCWIESAHDASGQRILVDLTFRHNRMFAEENGYRWSARHPPDFLWGPMADYVLTASFDALPATFPEGKVWYSESVHGELWMLGQLTLHENAIVMLTREVLRLYVERGGVLASAAQN